MATRATYSFERDFNEQTVTFYIHWDGYPEGAAMYFWNMHKNRHFKGGLADVFIKANPMSAEFTDNHEFHGDTEYRYYTNSDGNLVAKKREFHENKFIAFFEGHYAEFINTYNKFLVEKDSDYETLFKINDSVRIKTGSVSKYLTLSEVKQKTLTFYADVLEGLEQYKKDLALWCDEFHRIKALK